VEGNLFVSAYPPFSRWGSHCLSDLEHVLQTAPTDEQEVPLGLYVHIPFCLQRCQFCYYRSVANPTPETVDSYLAGIHCQNVGSLRDYHEKLAVSRLPHSRAYVLSRDERMVREFILQMKLGNVETGYFQSKFGENVARRFAETLQRFSDRGWLSVDGDSITLTREGLLRVDRMLPAFYLPEHRDLSYW
jgi:coproporphyrinogen III oxidase-like Fe-S oxidoreductase